MHHREINIGKLNTELSMSITYESGMQMQSKIKYVNNYYFVGMNE